MRYPGPPPLPRRSRASAALSVARARAPAVTDPAEADPAASTDAASRWGAWSSGRAASHSEGADRTADRCKPGRCTTDKADAVVAFVQSALGSNGCNRDDVDRSCPPHFCRVPAAQTVGAETSGEQR